MIVADSNLIAYLFIDGERTDVARRVHSVDPDWRAPLLWRSEFRNILTMTVRAGQMDPATALATWTEASTLIRDEPIAEARALLIALERGLTAYDAEFAALAEFLGARLVTVDRRLLRACPDLAVTPQAFAG